MNSIHSKRKLHDLGRRALSPIEFKQIAIETGALIIDTRPSSMYLEMHIPGSLFIGLDGSFAPWVGTLLHDPYRRILFIADEGREEEVISSLVKVGFDYCMGYLKGGLDAWVKQGYDVQSIESISGKELAIKLNSSELFLLDVRKKSEYDPGYLKGAIHIPLEQLHENISSIPKDEPVYIYCVNGYRSVIACSILKRLGRKNVVNVSEGFSVIKSSGLKPEIVGMNEIGNFF